MRTNSQRFRWLRARLPPSDRRRLVVLTGARQTGKTTLARKAYPDLRYVSLDAIEDREAVRGTPSAAWGRVVGRAVLDEAQKEPGVFDQVKYAYDAGQLDFSVLLGSSRILLLERVRETLAGRAFVFDLWPLMPSELLASEDGTARRPLLDRLVAGDEAPSEILRAEPGHLLGDEEGARREALGHLATWGGMPELLRLEDDERREWLRSYGVTWLERDLQDLVRLADLLPFRTLQRLAMLRSAGILSYAELARDAGVSAATARRYLEYLRVSYQAFLLPAFSRNLTSSAVKAPKLYFADLGLLRQGTQRWGPLDGAMFETLVVAEVFKWFATAGRELPFGYYRTRSGLEIDLLLQTPRGVLGIEIKNRGQAHAKDVTALRSVAGALGTEWLGGLVVYQGAALERYPGELEVWAVPAHRLF